MDKRIDEIEPTIDGTLMIHLVNGFCINDQGCHTFGADDKTELRQTMRLVKKCNCPECRQ